MWLQARRGLKRLWVPVAPRVWPLARLWHRVWGLPLDGHPEDRYIALIRAGKRAHGLPAKPVH